MKVGFVNFTGLGLPRRYAPRSGRKFRQSGINDRLRRHYRLIIKTGIGIASPATAGSQWHFPLCHYERRRSRSVVIRKGRVNRLWMLVRVRVMNFTGWGLPRSLCSLAMTAWGIALPLRRDRSGRKSCQSGINERLRRHYWLIIKTGIGIATSLRSSQWHIGDRDCPPAMAGSQWHKKVFFRWRYGVQWSRSEAWRGHCMHRHGRCTPNVHF